jgi:NAD+ kinase
MLFVDPHNPRSKNLVDQLSTFINLDAMSPHLVFGGDGWMLESIHANGVDKPFIGLNAGRLGFLMNDVPNVREIANQLSTEAWSTYAFPMLQAKIHQPDGTEISTKAVNDVYVARTDSRAANLRLEIDGATVVDNLVCDGLIVSTALGSTAYSSSAGGTPCHPLMRSIHVTPICPHTPQLRSFVLPTTAVVRIELLSVDRRPVQAVSDGKSHGLCSLVEISTSPTEVQLGFLENHQFTELLIKKILRS